MINEQRIRIMTAMAAYEKRHKEELGNTGKWFRGDYIGTHMLKSGCRLTLAFLIGFAFYCILHFDEIMERLNSMDILGLMKSALIVYGICLVLYLLLTYVTFSIRYHQGEKRRRTYYRLVERLENEYKHEKRTPARRRRREGQSRRN